MMGAEKCRLCVGSGNVTVELGGGEKEVSSCINCDGAGSLTCTTCQGSGVQPRYLDRRYTTLIFSFLAHCIGPNTPFCCSFCSGGCQGVQG